MKRAPKQYVRFGKREDDIDDEKRAANKRFGKRDDVSSVDKRAPKEYVRFGRRDGSEEEEEKRGINK